ncbi:hypothetical protein TIFTF001_030962 [Ficus carica]|uniref:Protein ACCUMULATION AND REPLICATION OF CHLOROPLASTS 3 n=1 Tax=Ficus carica TaxID=3494 RepID=A0AA88J5P8_FICCA|nr:hypothetical protein TIFTF001_030962 [Ficus carica]
MELPVFTSFRSWTRVFSCPCSTSNNPTLFFINNNCSFHRTNFSLRLNFGLWNPRLRIIAAKNSPSNRCGEAEREANCGGGGGDFWRDSEFVEVIGIGSRKDAVLNFCLESPFQSSSLRYWNIVAKNSMKLQLQQRVLGKGGLLFQSSTLRIEQVASAGYGMDHISAIDILKTIRSSNGFTVAIILKPFSFEGQRRRDEVKELMEKLQEHTDLFIDLDTDKLLKKDLVTLDEAIKTANNAVLMSVTAVSVLKSDLNRKLTGASYNDVKEIEISEVFRILERYKEAKIGFGAGYNIKTSILKSLYDCPFLNVDVKWTASFSKEWHLYQGSSVPERGFTSEVTRNINDVDVITDGSDKYSEYLERGLNNSNEFPASNELEPSKDESFEAATEFSSFHDPSSEETPAFQREELVGWNLGLGYQIAQAWAKERAAEASATSTLDKLSLFCLPVGVRPLQELKDRINISSPTQHPTLKTEDVVKAKPGVNLSTPSWNELTDTGLEAVRDFYNTASALLKGNPTDPPKKEGLLSARAASMLEAERDSPKKWSPTVEMKYRGGIYKGRCQGGLPEGKDNKAVMRFMQGRLVLGDGSIYDGMWRYGKRSGSGTFYFSNGDVFQGSWRDDVMHGKVLNFEAKTCSDFVFVTGDAVFSFALDQVGFIFTLEIDGLQTSGRERLMAKAASIPSLVMSFLVISKMDGDMASSFVLMLMEGGQFTLSSYLWLLEPLVLLDEG